MESEKKEAPQQQQMQEQMREQMRERLLFLRGLLVRQERSYREDLKQQAKIVSTLKKSLHESKQHEYSKRDEIAKLKAENSTSQLVMREYEQLIEYVTAWKEEARIIFQENKEALQQEVEEVKEHLENTQKAYADLEMKGRSAGSVLHAEQQAVAALARELEKHARDVDELKAKFAAKRHEAESQCASANEQLAAMGREQRAEASRLSAHAQRARLRVSSLQEALEQKTAENRALVAMCDDLIDHAN